MSEKSSSTSATTDKNQADAADQSKHECMARAEEECRVVDELLAASSISDVLAAANVKVGLLAVRLHLLRATKGITDPIEKMLVQDFVIGHHRLQQLHVLASKATCPETSKMYNAAAVALQREQGRLGLDIKKYRAPVAQRNFSVITQQNVVANGQQSVHYADDGPEKESLHVKDEPEDQGDLLDERIGGGNGEVPEASQGGATRLNIRAAMEAAWCRPKATSPDQ